MDNFYNTKDIKRIFGANLQKIRKSRSLKQEVVAADLGLSTNSLSKIENGITWPHARLITEIMKYFELPAFIFFIDRDNDFEAYKISVIENITNSAEIDYDKIRALYQIDVSRKRTK